MREYWLHNNGEISNTADCDGAGVWCTARRVAVIDPEDSEAVERLGVLVRQQGGLFFGEMRRSALQAALHEFASPKPPKPEEPMGLGAVAKDDCGLRWVRFACAEVCSRPWVSGGGTWERSWADINAVTVLSEGVSDA